MSVIIQAKQPRVRKRNIHVVYGHVSSSHCLPAVDNFPQNILLNYASGHSLITALCKSNVSVWFVFFFYLEKGVLSMSILSKQHHQSIVESA